MYIEECIWDLFITCKEVEKVGLAFRIYTCKEVERLSPIVVTVEVFADPTGISGAGMVLHSCHKLRQRAWALYPHISQH